MVVKLMPNASTGNRANTPDSIDEIVASALMSVRMEGFTLSDDDISLCERLAQHNITLDEYLSIVLTSVGAS